jgi:hypothetical protein
VARVENLCESVGTSVVDLTDGGEGTDGDSFDFKSPFWYFDPVIGHPNNPTLGIVVENTGKL